MPMHRHDRLPGGSHYVRRTTWEDEAAGAIVDGAASAAGWVIGSGISGLRSLARNSQDRRLARAATALDEASESEDLDQFLALATDFTRRYPQLADGHASLAQALQRKGQFEAAVESLDRAVQLGVDETQAHMLRADIYDDAGKPGKAIQEYTMVTQVSVPELRQVSLLSRARLLMQIGDLNQALKDANDAIATLPDEAGYCVRGHIYRSKGELEKSIDDYTRAIQLCADIPDFFENRAAVYEMLGKTDEAQSDRLTAAASAQAVSPAEPQEASTTGPATAAQTVGRSSSTAIPSESSTEDLTKYSPWMPIVVGLLLVLLSAASGVGFLAVLGFLAFAGGVSWLGIRSASKDTESSD